MIVIIILNMIHSVLARNEYTITITVLTTPGNLQCWCGGCWRETGTGHQQRHWAGTWYTGAGVVSGHYHLTEHNTQYSERVPILALSH